MRDLDAVATRYVPPSPSIHTQCVAESFHAVRNVDWRFLLPSPRLGRVVIAEPLRSGLRAALHRFSTTLVGVRAVGRNVVPCDVAVACDPSESVLLALTEHLRADGTIYIETQGDALREQLKVLSHLGYREPTTYWHWPSFEKCEEIVPLNDPIAVAHSLARRQTGRSAWIKVEFCRLLHALGILPRFLPCVGITAVRSS